MLETVMIPFSVKDFVLPLQPFLHIHINMRDCGMKYVNEDWLNCDHIFNGQMA